MWSKSYSKKVKGITADQIWKVWVDINQWNTWMDDIEYAKMEGEFKVGNTYLLKPQGGPEVKIEILRVEKNINFTDLTRFPLATMTGSHDFIWHGDELEIKTTMTVQGPLSFVWRKIVGEGVANGMEVQTEQLLDRIRKISPNLE